MDLNDYQLKAISTAIYPTGYRVIYPTLGLTGEAGEVAEKVKKTLRDGGLNVESLRKELGDVLWYLAALARDLGLTLEEIAQENLKKLQDRKDRGVLKGSGDDR